MKGCSSIKTDNLYHIQTCSLHQIETVTQAQGEEAQTAWQHNMGIKSNCCFFEQSLGWRVGAL